MFAYPLSVRRDIEHDLIHLRSASRIGGSDFGVNRNRADQLIHCLKQNAEFVD